MSRMCMSGLSCEVYHVRCVKSGVSSQVCQVVLPPLEEGACEHVRCVNMRCVGIG
jgi:hypothetical protein